MHQFILHNGELREATERFLSPGQVGLLAGWGVFSTIRVVDGVPFAFELHWSRMVRDAALMRVPCPDDPDMFRRDLLKLIRANKAPNATLRVVVVRNRGGMWEGPVNDRDSDIIAFTTDLKNWGEGAKLAVTPEARHAACKFTGTKILSWAMNLSWLEEAHSRGYDETVLLNERGEVCECTSANILIAQGDRVWTPPLSSGCLPGVTREVLLGKVRAPGIEIGERVLRMEDLEKADEVFVTSTTRGVFPVLAIEGIRVGRNSAVRNVISEAFSKYVNAYVAEHIEDSALDGTTSSEPFATGTRGQT